MWMKIKPQLPSEMNRSEVAGKLKGQICEFSGKLCEGLLKVVGRFVGEALFGVLSKQSVRVAEMARSLNEPIRLIKTENRLCRELGRRELAERITNRVIEQGRFMSTRIRC
jgi:hypothetical protein